MISVFFYLILGRESFFVKIFCSVEVLLSVFSFATFPFAVSILMSELGFTVLSDKNDITSPFLFMIWLAEVMFALMVFMRITPPEQRPFSC